MSNKKKNSKSKKVNKGAKGKKSTMVGVKDPIGVRVVFSLFIIFMILTFAVGGVSIWLTSTTIEHDGIMFLGDKYYAAVSNYNGIESETGCIFNNNRDIAVGDAFGFLHVVDNKIVVVKATATSIDGNKIITDIATGGTNLPVDKSKVLGKFVDVIPSPIFLYLATTPTTFLLVFAACVAITIIMGLIHYLVSPRGAKQFDKKAEEKNVQQVVTTVSSENSELLTHYLSTDDNVQPMEAGENKLGDILNINYYNSVRLHNGEVYAVVKKYHEAVRALEEYGASDMDIIKMNMIGNSEFDDLILNTHKEKTMSMWEIIDFTRKLDGVYCIKKRGTLNWTYKYKTKTILILKREDNESDSYKVSIKVYPDAATKLNIIYKALEDSSFPIGPYWYMFNDLRNLPANVIKWLIVESLNISKWQQIKADLLRDTPTLESYKIDKAYMHDMILAGTRKLDMGKFDIITQDDTADAVKFDTVLETGFSDMSMDEFTKEIAMSVPGMKNTQMSILTRKNASEALVTALCNELSDFDKAKETPQNANPNDMNKIVNTPVATKVVKKSKKK